MHQLTEPELDALAVAIAHALDDRPFIIGLPESVVENLTKAHHKIEDELDKLANRHPEGPPFCPECESTDVTWQEWKSDDSTDVKYLCEACNVVWAEQYHE